MRKILYLFACLALLACPVACKKQQEGSDNSAAQTTNSPADTTATGSATPDMNNQPATPVEPGSANPAPAEITPGTNPNPDNNGNPGNPNPTPPPAGGGTAP